MKNAEKKAEVAMKAKGIALKKVVATKCVAEKAKNALGAFSVSNGIKKIVKDSILNSG